MGKWLSCWLRLSGEWMVKWLAVCGLLCVGVGLYIDCGLFVHAGYWVKSEGGWWFVDC